MDSQERYKEHLGIRFSETELKDFKRVFPGTPAANLFGKMISKLSGGWSLRLTSLGAPADTVRQAQGALDALGSLMQAGVEFAALDVDWEKEAEGDQVEEEEAVDVGY